MKVKGQGNHNEDSNGKVALGEGMASADFIRCHHNLLDHRPLTTDH